MYEYLGVDVAVVVVVVVVRRKRKYGGGGSRERSAQVSPKPFSPVAFFPCEDWEREAGRR